MKVGLFRDSAPGNVQLPHATGAGGNDQLAKRSMPAKSVKHSEAGIYAADLFRDYALVHPQPPLPFTPKQPDDFRLPVGIEIEGFAPVENTGEVRRVRRPVVARG